MAEEKPDEQKSSELFEASYIERESEQEPVFDCPVCSNSFQSKEDVEKHVKNHIQILTPSEINDQSLKKTGNIIQVRDNVETSRKVDEFKDIITPSIPEFDTFGVILETAKEYGLLHNSEEENLLPDNHFPYRKKKAPKFFCKPCQRSFQNEYHMNLHGKKTHKYDHKCSRCHKPFHFEHILKEHEKTHQFPLITKHQKIFSIKKEEDNVDISNEAIKDSNENVQFVSNEAMPHKLTEEETILEKRSSNEENIKEKHQDEDEKSKALFCQAQLVSPIKTN